MRSEMIEAKLAELRADPDGIPWRDRVRLAGDVLGGVARTRPLSAATGEMLRLLAADPKWEVRKQVADHIHKLGENDFGVFAGLLAGDDNAFVKAAVERALSRRRKGHAQDTKRVRGLSRIEADIKQIEVRHGAKASRTIREMAHRLYEGLVGASVHEMRSIVTAMKATVEQLERAPETETGPAGRKAAPRLAKQVAFLERLLADMRDYTRAPSKERASERVADLLAEAMGMVRDELVATGRDASGIIVEIDVPEDLSVAVSRVQVVLALRNLLKNAYEAFSVDETSFQSGQIQVTASPHEDGVKVVIADTGMGLDPRELEEVLRFIPGRTSKSYLGTGFGLPIAQRNIVGHGGSLWIESRVEEGTTVSVWLPATGRAWE